MSGGSRFGQGLFGAGVFAFGYTLVAGTVAVASVSFSGIDATSRARNFDTIGMVVSSSLIPSIPSYSLSFSGPALVITTSFDAAAISQYAGIVGDALVVDVSLWGSFVASPYWASEDAGGSWTPISKPDGFWVSEDASGSWAPISKPDDFWVPVDRNNGGWA